MQSLLGIHGMDATCPHVRQLVHVDTPLRLHGRISTSAQTRLCICTDVIFLPLGNFKMDATVRSNHRRPSGHHLIFRLSVRLSFVIICVTTLMSSILRQLLFGNPLILEDENTLLGMESNMGLHLWAKVGISSVGDQWDEDKEDWLSLRGIQCKLPR